MEQRVHHVADGGEQSRDHADHVSRPLSDFEGALEPDHCRARLQCAQDFHGNELQTFRRAHGQLQIGTTEVTKDRFLKQLSKRAFFNCSSVTVQYSLCSTRAS